MVVELKSKKVEYVKGVLSYDLLRRNGSDLITYSPNSADNQTIFRSLKGGQQKVYLDLVFKIFDKATHQALLVSKNNGIYRLFILDLDSWKEHEVWKGRSEISNIVYSNSFKKLAWVSEGEIWYLDSVPSEKTAKKIKLTSPANLKFSALTNFGINDDMLYLNFTEIASKTYSDKAVEIFSYQDMAFNIDEKPRLRNRQFQLNCVTEELRQIERNEFYAERIMGNGNVALFRDVNPLFESYWNKKQKINFVLETISTGAKQNILIDWIWAYSEDERFLIGQNAYMGDIISFDRSNNRYLNLTADLPIPKYTNISEDLEECESRGLWFVKLLDDQRILVADQFDLWIIDVSGQQPAVCLTENYGRKNKIKFRLLDGQEFTPGKPIILSAFNEANKQAGFFGVKYQAPNSLIKLSMGNYSYEPGQLDNKLPFVIKKCKSGNRWILWRESISESPNYFWTSDFKTFNKVSDLSPEKNYDWFSSELIDYTTKNGVRSQAILYKPSHFDPKKKYPVLFNFYEKRTPIINNFLTPDFGTFEFNYAMMLAQGWGFLG